MDSAEIIKFENVSYKLENSNALNDFSFTLNKGENLVIFGPENSGLEIICAITAGLIKVYQGSVNFKGREIKTLDYLDSYSVRKEIGYLQKDYGLISNMTVFENIALPLRYHSHLSGFEIDNLVNNLIEQMNLWHCKDLRPVNLRKSEVLRTAYLRAVSFDPELILVEHSLEGQCQINAQTFLRSLKKESFSGSKSVIFITYYPRLFTDLSDNFIMLFEGNTVFSGNRSDFISTDNEYVRQYLESSLEGPMKIL
ncbi:MAG: ATP-binding cassette domain-containing protein [Spirochaetes bacterium]|nr:ATP-binding cassette domain-containing protein [Spirochaetota bacterium]